MKLLLSQRGRPFDSNPSRWPVRWDGHTPRLRRDVSPRAHYIVRPLPRTPCKAPVDDAHDERPHGMMGDGMRMRVTEASYTKYLTFPTPQLAASSLHACITLLGPCRALLARRRSILRPGFGWRSRGESAPLCASHAISMPLSLLNRGCPRGNPIRMRMLPTGSGQWCLYQPTSLMSLNESVRWQR